MAKDVIITDITDEAVTRIWEAVMEQAAKEYIDLYRVYLVSGPNATKKLPFSSRTVRVKDALIELEDFILGDLIAGPHADYIVKKLREEAIACVNANKKKRRIIRRKEILKRG